MGSVNMTNLNNIKSNNSIVLNEIKYCAMAGYSVESVDFNDDTIKMIRHLDTTKHPLSLVNIKNKKLHLVCLSTEKPVNQITAMSNSTIVEGVFTSPEYESYVKNSGEQAYQEYQKMCYNLQQLGAKEFDEKSKIIYSQIKSVSPAFNQRLQQHLETVRNVLVNAELCDESFLASEIKELNCTKQRTLDTQMEKESI